MRYLRYPSSQCLSHSFLIPSTRLLVRGDNDLSPSCICESSLDLTSILISVQDPEELSVLDPSIKVVDNKCCLSFISIEPNTLPLSQDEVVIVLLNCFSGFSCSSITPIHQDFKFPELFRVFFCWSENQSLNTPSVFNILHRCIPSYLCEGLPFLNTFCQTIKIWSSPRFNSTISVSQSRSWWKEKGKQITSNGILQKRRKSCCRALGDRR